jgi:hypothetical protein
MTAGSTTAVSGVEATMARRPFSIGRVSFCLLPLLALALWVVALSGLATAGGTATAASPCRSRLRPRPQTSLCLSSA